LKKGDKMRQKKVMLLLIPVLFIWFSECSDPVPNKIVLNVPYYSQEGYPNYCAVACIRMWAAYSGNQVTMQEIADYVGVGPDGVLPRNIEKGVGNFTSAEGYMPVKSVLEPGAQGDLIGATVIGVKNGYPSIIPVYNADHAVLSIGNEWHEDENYRPIADVIYFHDPNVGPNRKRAANIFLGAYFTPSYGRYWLIVAFPDFLDDGIEGHDEFVMAGGTYYGGPVHYDPKGINPNPID
jgi:hypothetical protein